MNSVKLGDTLVVSMGFDDPKHSKPLLSSIGIGFLRFLPIPYESKNGQIFVIN